MRGLLVGCGTDIEERAFVWVRGAKKTGGDGTTKLDWPGVIIAMQNDKKASFYMLRRTVKRGIIWCLMLLSVVLPGAVLAEELSKIFANVNDYVSKRNYPKAMQELSWARKELEKLHQARLTELLPAEINGLKGGDAKIESALGFTNVERTYSDGSKELRLSITGSSGSEGFGSFGGLAEIARMGAMMGTQPGVEQFRIDGRTAALNTEAPDLTVFLESGSMLQITGSDVDAASLKKAAEGLKLSELDSYLGSK